MGDNKTGAMAEQIRHRLLAEAGQMAPVALTGSDSDSITQGVTAGVQAYQKGTKPSHASTSPGFAAQRAGEREDMSRFGDDKEKLGAAIARSLMGSKRFTKGEVRKGYRRLG
jgi:hypothetical protein